MPIQFLGPIPNGIQATGWRFTVCRSGEKTFGSSGPHKSAL